MNLRIFLFFALALTAIFPKAYAKSETNPYQVLNWNKIEPGIKQVIPGLCWGGLYNNRTGTLHRALWLGKKHGCERYHPSSIILLDSYSYTLSTTPIKFYVYLLLAEVQTPKGLEKIKIGEEKSYGKYEGGVGWELTGLCNLYGDFPCTLVVDRKQMKINLLYRELPVFPPPASSEEMKPLSSLADNARVVLKADLKIPARSIGLALTSLESHGKIQTLYGGDRDLTLDGNHCKLSWAPQTVTSTVSKDTVFSLAGPPKKTEERFVGDWGVISIVTTYEEVSLRASQSSSDSLDLTLRCRCESGPGGCRTNISKINGSLLNKIFEIKEP